MENVNVNEILFNDEAKSRLKAGIDIACDAVKVTLGPQGRNVIIRRGNEYPHITKDGVTVAKEIFLNDPYKMMGANLIKNIASKTCDDAGDGTSTGVVLAQKIIDLGYKVVKIKKENPISLKRGLDKASSIVIDFVKKQSIKIDNDVNLIKQIATISANNDEFIGELISKAMDHVGEYGAVTVDKSNSSETSLSISDGFRIAKRGYISPYFITDQAKDQCILEDAFVYITDQKIDTASEAIGILNQAAKQNASLLIIADDITNDALSTLVINKLQGGMKVCAIKAPDFGDVRKKSIDDIALLTGGKAFSTIKSEGQYGFAKKVIIEKENTIIVGGDKIYKDQFTDKINELKTLIKDSKIDFDKKIYEERLARFSNGIAVLNIGAKTEIELNEKVDRIDDALCATRAAIEEGVVPGGGIVFLKAKNELIKNKYKFSKEELPGYDIMLEVLSTPIKQILINAGAQEIDYIIGEIEAKKNLFYGYNAKTYKYGNLFKQGVIDPAKVLRVSLENAISVSTLFLTTECAILSND